MFDQQGGGQAGRGGRSGRRPPPSPLREDEDEDGRPYSESESEGEFEEQPHEKPVARIATRAPPSYSRSFSEPDLSPVAETGPGGRGESDLTSSSFSASGGGRSAAAGGSDGRCWGGGAGGVKNGKGSLSAACLCFLGAFPEPPSSTAT